MKKVLIFAAVAEAATGLALLIAPSLVGQLLLGEQLTGIAIPVARVAGIEAGLDAGGASRLIRTTGVLPTVSRMFCNFSTSLSRCDLGANLCSR